MSIQSVPNWDGPLYIVHQLYDSKTAHGCSPGCEQSAVNDIFVHLLYGFVRLPEVGPEQHTGYLYTTCTKLGGPALPCTIGVQLPHHSRMLTSWWRTMSSERHFRTPPVRICTAPRSWTGTAHLGYVYTTYTKLRGPGEPSTTSVRRPERSWMFFRPLQTIFSERHFRTPPVRICTVPRIRTRTAQLGCVCVQSTPNL